MKRGFTLIELLAVIVILAIIALIATPIILGIINDAREDANKRSVENYAHAVELAIARYATKKGGVIEPGIYEIVPEFEGKKIKSKNGNTIDVDYKGEAIKRGSLKVLSDGKIELTEISFDGKLFYNYSEEDGVTKNENSESGDKEESSPFKVTKDGVLLHYERQGNETSVVVPAEVNGIKIKKIAASAFMPGNCIIFMTEGYALKLDNEYTEEEAAFAQQNNLRVITMEQLEKGEVSVTFEDFVSSSHMYYKGTIDLTTEEKITYVYDYDKSSYYLENIDLSNMIYLERILADAFRGYNKNDYSYDICGDGSLKSVKFPLDGVLTTIGENAFSNNNITTVTIPASVTTIGNYAFRCVSTVKVLGDQSRFDVNWYGIFRNATKITE